MSVWKLHGRRGLARYAITPPSWDEVQWLNGPDCSTVDNDRLLHSAAQCLALPPAWESEDPTALQVTVTTEPQQVASRFRVLADAIRQTNASASHAVQQALSGPSATDSIVTRREVLQWVLGHGPASHQKEQRM